MSDRGPYRKARRLDISLRFAWYDLWIGAYVDTAKRTLYVCPLPCVLVTIKAGEQRG